MKQRAKLFLILASLLCLVGVGVAQSKTQPIPAMPFPGAVVVLDDASWRSRANRLLNSENYLWAASDTVLYTQHVGNDFRILRRRVTPNGEPALPETLPVVLKEMQWTESMSPDGTTLCVGESVGQFDNKYTLIRTDKKEKPLVIFSRTSPLLWSSDSKHLYATGGEYPQSAIKCYDARTGTVTKTFLDPPEYLYFTCVTPEGKLLQFVPANQKQGSPHV